MTACPNCGEPIDNAVQVGAETVIDMFEIWLAQENAAQTRLTERIPVICIQEKGIALPEETSHGNSRQDDP
jgi:uncharacterized protein (UPF0212 family)